ncbi:IS630 family transposase [Kitasatospora sp. NPDC054768]
MAYGHKTPHQTRQRATVVLLAARGRSNARIAAQTRLHVDTVRTWRGRFAAGGLPALADRKRSGRPVSFTALQVAEVKALACQLTARTGAPLARWLCPELAREVVARSIAGSISTSTVRRWLKRDTLKPWQYRSWISVRDPAFRPKAARVLDLYARTFDGAPLGQDEYVLSADEKTSIQARCRCRPTLAPGQARAMRVNHDYNRGGALAYLAAYDVHRARVFGRCEPTAQPFQWRFTTSDLDDLLASLDRRAPAGRRRGARASSAGRSRRGSRRARWAGARRGCPRLGPRCPRPTDGRRGRERLPDRRAPTTPAFVGPGLAAYRGRSG